MVSNWINIECPTEAEKKYLLEELQIQKLFTTTLKILTNDPRIEGKRMDIIMRIPVKSNDVKLPFHTIPGIVLKMRFVLL
jgi:magnesium transporter